MAAASWHDKMVAGSIVVSAGTYNMVAAYLYAMLATLAIGHSLNALLFKLKFTARHEAPIVAAYFLPLTHLYRLLHLLWCTVSCQGVQDIISPKLRGLYCILATAMEGIPMLNLQFIGYHVLRVKGVPVQRMSSAFKVSVAAALISATYNGGTSVHSIANNATTLKQKLCAGAIAASFTLNATIVRCLTITNLAVYIQEYIWTRSHKPKVYVSDFIPTLIFMGSVVAYCLYFWLLHLPREFSKSLQSPRPLLIALTFSYMSTYTSPLYPLIDQAKDANQLGSYIFRLKLLIVSLLHLSLDLAVLCVTRVLGTLPRPCLIVSSLAALGYIFSLLAYMNFDASCGPIMSSNVSLIQVAHGGGDTVMHDHNQLTPLSELCILTNVHPRKTEKLEINALVSQHENLSYQNTKLAMCQNVEALDCALERKKSNRSAHPHSFDLVEAKGRVPLLTSSLSLDRGIDITIKRQRPSLAAWPSSKRYSRAYSQSKEARGYSP